MNYKQLTDKQNIKNIYNKVYEEFKDEWLNMQCITLYEKLMIYSQKIKNKKFWEEVEERKNENKRFKK